MKSKTLKKDRFNQQQLSRSLVEAAKKDQVHKMGDVLAKGADIHFNEDEALYAAAWRGRKAAIHFLVSRGAHAASRDSGGAMEAARGKHRSIVKFLVKHGADSDALNVLEMCEKGYDPRKSGWGDLIHAANSGDSDVMRILLRSYPVTLTLDNLATLVVEATLSGHEKTVSVILECVREKRYARTEVENLQTQQQILIKALNKSFSMFRQEGIKSQMTANDDPQIGKALQLFEEQIEHEVMNRHQLWSDNPNERLKAANSITNDEKVALHGNLRKDSPAKPKWPFGMPTSVNPYIVVLGVSPGARTDDNECTPYDLPTIGSAHDGFGGEFTKAGEEWDGRRAIAYWQKVRDLCISVLQSVNPKLTPAECIALSGHLNLGTAQEGKAGTNALDSKIIRWIPGVILNQLKPKIVVCFGLKKLLNESRVKKSFQNSSFSQVLTEPTTTVLLKSKSKRQFRYSIWDIVRPDGFKMSITLWPNHPSRPPFTSGKVWKQSIEQFVSILQLQISR